MTHLNFPKYVAVFRKRYKINSYNEIVTENHMWRITLNDTEGLFRCVKPI